MARPPIRKPRKVIVEGTEVPLHERRVRKNRFTTPLDAIREAENRYGTSHQGRVPLHESDGMSKAQKRGIRRVFRPWGRD
jgi:hypothetical protein